MIIFLCSSSSGFPESGSLTIIISLFALSETVVEIEINDGRPQNPYARHNVTRHNFKSLVPYQSKDERKVMSCQDKTFVVSMINLFVVRIPLQCVPSGAPKYVVHICTGR